eukprot:861509-Pleurochrysis_carterae.AAC.1
MIRQTLDAAHACATWCKGACAARASRTKAVRTVAVEQSDGALVISETLEHLRHATLTKY